MSGERERVHEFVIIPDEQMKGLYGTRIISPEDPANYGRSRCVVQQSGFLSEKFEVSQFHFEEIIGEQTLLK